MLLCDQACRLKKYLEAGMLVGSVEAGMAGKRSRDTIPLKFKCCSVIIHAD
jgi:hypothetical protein